ncbi:MAG: alpha/beta hydrolase [Gemmatimonadaceae bacterium]
METLQSRAAGAVRLGAIALVSIGLCRASFGHSLQAAQPQAVSRQAAPAAPRIVRNVRFGPDLRQRFDVYAPPDAKDAPVIFMVHGGGWAYGDKSARGVTGNKVARWVPRGFIVISTNYRMLPEADPLEQAKDVARAIAVAQQRVTEWGGSAARFILMGHSAGAHLVTLLATSPSLTRELPIIPWLGVVSIESGALDIPEIMRAPHVRLYDRAFGRDTAYWRSVSPIAALTGAARPILLVCSIRRPASCNRADRFAAKGDSLGVRVSVLREDLSHADADARLGLDPGYTSAVESFLRSLDVTLEKQLPVAPAPQR